MKHENPLSDLYHCYTTGSLQKKDFEGRIFQYLLGNLKRYRIPAGNNSSRWNEFLSWLYPRLARAIDLYRDLGSSFDAYIAGIINKASKEYRCRETDHRITEYACWQARAEEMAACESGGEYEYEHERPEFCNNVSIPKGVKPRQVLLLLLKSYYFVSDEFARHVARVIGMKADEVMKMVDELHKLRSEKETEILNLRDRVFCQHYRCLAYQKRMDVAQPGTDYHRKIKDRYERARKRFHSMKKRLGKMRLDASNQMIANVVGIPKGTVDSGLFAVKNHLASCAGLTV